MTALEGRSRRWRHGGVSRGTTLASLIALTLCAARAAAEPLKGANDAPATSGPFARATPPDDPTGGAYTTPTLLFTPAAAVPAWNARVITSLDVQGPTPPDRLAVGTAANGMSAVGFQPAVGAEIGLPYGVTMGSDAAVCYYADVLG